MAHFNGVLARGGGNLNNNFQKSNTRGGARRGELKLPFNRYIIEQ